jgi:toxin ParE1/3/4
VKRLRLHPEAGIEAAEASDWYENDYPGRGARFRDAMDVEVRRILAAPHTFPLWRRRRDVRVAVVPSFPYTLIFAPEGNVVVLYAVAHDKRRPGYWRNRLRKA